MSETPTKREDAEIWADWHYEAEQLVRELELALKVAKIVRAKINHETDLESRIFRDAEKHVYAAYRRVGTMSGLIDEIDDDE